MTAFNAFMGGLLRSPLHFLASGRMMLITFKGKRSGKQYTVPVDYARYGDIVTVFSRPERTWWRNLRGGAPVTVWIRGRELEGTAEVVDADEEAMESALKAFYPRKSPEKLAGIAKKRVMVRVLLGEGTEDV